MLGSNLSFFLRGYPFAPAAFIGEMSPALTNLGSPVEIVIYMFWFVFTTLIHCTTDALVYLSLKSVS